MWNVLLFTLFTVFVEGLVRLCLQNAHGVSPDNHPIPTFVPLSGIVPGRIFYIMRRTPDSQRKVFEDSPKNLYLSFVGRMHTTQHKDSSSNICESGVVRKRNLLLEMSYSNYRKRNGMDYRHISNSTQHMDELHRIYRIFQIDKTLQILRNPAIPDHIKLDLIEKHGITPANISAGGLMDDFNGIDF